MALRPLIAICGTTGVGKSNLAIEIALNLSQPGSRKTWNGAKIINADAMQVYAGMDIITNKVPLPERQGIDHALMGFKSPNEQYVVGEWVRDALKAVDDAHSKDQVPIVVGGTSYWIQHLLFPNRLVKDMSDPDSRPSSPVSIMSDELAKSIVSLPTELQLLYNALPDPAPNADTDPEGAFALYNLLKALDISVAERWHWRDTRKVLRSVRIIRDTGRKPSEMIDEQSQEHIKPRFRTLCFWVYARPDILKPRLDQRVDKMMEQGLLDEVRGLQEIVDSSSEVAGRSGMDYTFGLYQSIGYREFHSYLLLPNPEQHDLEAALLNMKTSTRQYAKRQTSWLRNKLLPALYAANGGDQQEQSTFTYLLDATELGEKWFLNVREPAIRLSNAFLDKQPLEDPLSLSETAKEILDVERKDINPNAVLSARQKIVCPICTVDSTKPFMVEEGREWQLHQKTRAHRRKINKAYNESQIEARRCQSQQKADGDQKPSSDGDNDWLGIIP